VSVTGIVLAGGRASRFGGPKLSAVLDGESILALAIAAVTAAADHVIVAGPELPEELGTAATPVDLVGDAEPFAGPLAALANVLGRSVPEPGDLAIVVGGDMPRLIPGVLRSMLDVLREDPAVDAVLLGRPGPSAGAEPARTSRRQVLPLAVRVDAARREAATAIDQGERSLQALVDRLARVELPASTWMELDPDASTLLDVDTRADLERIRRSRNVT
jgi:molybdopterin-guanine dinucleotide biosynthesis protein A